ncbi:MAG: hypothetical protein WA603_03150, partial [Candidatus Acidiferrales bacterium]
ALYPPRWTLGENPSSQPGRDLARKYKTAQNFRNWWLRFSGTHNIPSPLEILDVAQSDRKSKFLQKF